MQINVVPYQAFPSIGYAINAFQSQNGRMSLPVSPSTYIYAQFEHVSGVPAPDGVQGVSINRLKILDTLIGQLAQMKQSPEPVPITEEVDGEKIVSMIEQYQEQIRNIQEARSNSPYALTPPVTGSLFNLFV